MKFEKRDLEAFSIFRENVFNEMSWTKKEAWCFMRNTWEGSVLTTILWCEQEQMGFGGGPYWYTEDSLKEDFLFAFGVEVFKYYTKKEVMEAMDSIASENKNESDVGILITEEEKKEALKYQVLLDEKILNYGKIWYNTHPRNIFNEMYLWY